MNTIKRKIFIVFVTGMALTAPIVAVVAIQDLRRETALEERRKAENDSRRASEDARYQYYRNVAEQRERLRQGMKDSKEQYDRALENQDADIAAREQTVTRTTVEPVMTTQAVSSSDSASISAPPKASAKTKTS